MTAAERKEIAINAVTESIGFIHETTIREKVSSEILAFFDANLFGNNNFNLKIVSILEDAREHRAVMSCDESDINENITVGNLHQFITDAIEMRVIRIMQDLRILQVKISIDDNPKQSDADFITATGFAKRKRYLYKLTDDLERYVEVVEVKHDHLVVRHTNDSRPNDEGQLDFNIKGNSLRSLTEYND